MMPLRIFAAAALAACSLAVAPCAAAPADSTGTVLYALATPPSALEVGCQGPCQCPIVSTPTYGSFALVPAGSDPLYTYYTVERFIASFNNGPGAVAITGAGQYRIGGEVALLQQLTLDLQVEGGPTQRFDSGLQPAGAPFPQINLSCAVHGFYCLDSVLVVSAKPAGTTGSPSPRSVSDGLRSVQPNPCASRTSFVFALDLAGTVNLTVVDIEGRRVCALANGQSFEPGLQSVTWDGRRDDGRAAPAGVYWVLLRWSGGADRRRFVKLS